MTIYMIYDLVLALFHSYSPCVSTLSIRHDDCDIIVCCACALGVTVTL